MLLIAEDYEPVKEQQHKKQFKKSAEKFRPSAGIASETPNAPAKNKSERRTLSLELPGNIPSEYEKS